VHLGGGEPERERRERGGRGYTGREEEDALPPRVLLQHAQRQTGDRPTHLKQPKNRILVLVQPVAFF